MRRSGGPPHFFARRGSDPEPFFLSGNQWVEGLRKTGRHQAEERNMFRNILFTTTVLGLGSLAAATSPAAADEPNSGFGMRREDFGLGRRAQRMGIIATTTASSPRIAEAVAGGAGAAGRRRRANGRYRTFTRLQWPIARPACPCETRRRAGGAARKSAPPRGFLPIISRLLCLLRLLRFHGETVPGSEARGIWRSSRRSPRCVCSPICTTFRFDVVVAQPNRQAAVQAQEVTLDVCPATPRTRPRTPCTRVDRRAELRGWVCSPWEA